MTCFVLCMARTALRNNVSFYFNQHLISEQVCWKIVVPCRVNASKLLLTVFCTKKLNTFGENHFGKKLCSFSVYDLFFSISRLQNSSSRPILWVECAFWSLCWRNGQLYRNFLWKPREFQRMLGKYLLQRCRCTCKSKGNIHGMKWFRIHSFNIYFRIMKLFLYSFFIHLIFPLQEAQMQGSGAIIHGLTWDCSAEFAATADQSISLLHENSFVSFPNWISKTGAIISFRVNIQIWYDFKYILFKNNACR